MHGQYQGHSKEATIVLEAVASQDFWIWHVFFGMPGSHNDINVLQRSENNDINVLQRSPLLKRLCDGKAPPCNYTVNGNDYTMGYYIVYGIYPQWAAFVKTISNPTTPKRRAFAAA